MPRSLQVLLTVLDGQKLTAGYLTPKTTALETCIDLMNKFDYWTLLNQPISSPALLFTPAWVDDLTLGQSGIYLDNVDGNLDLSKAGPAYKFSP